MALNWNAKGSERVAQNVQNLIALRRYELPFYRRWGIDPAIIDDTEPSMRARAIAEACDVVSSGEPRAAIEGIFFDGAGELVVKLKC